MKKSRIDYISDGLEAFKARTHLSNRDIGHTLGISDNTVARVIQGDVKTRLSVETIWEIEKIAMEGLKYEHGP